MGCGQSKINIYPRKSKGKSSAKKIVTDKPEGEEEEGAENEHQDLNSGLDECDNKKKSSTRTKPITHVGGPLLAQTELSSSQHNFFKMLDEKIENGPDYDSTDETERALEAARLHALLKDWETASASSRSLPTTPRHIGIGTHRTNRPIQSAPKSSSSSSHSRIPANIIHQGYGVTTTTITTTTTTTSPNSVMMATYRHTNYNPSAYQSYSPIHQTHHSNYTGTATTPSGLQYHQEYSNYIYNTPRQYHPVPTYVNNIPKPNKYISYGPVPVQNSPTHKLYTNGELIIQDQLYSQQIQYQQSREYQQYRQNREQLLVQQQLCAPTRVNSTTPHYQSSVHVPIVTVLPSAQQQQSHQEQSPKMLQRKQLQQRQYPQEMT